MCLFLLKSNKNQRYLRSFSNFQFCPILDQSRAHQKGDLCYTWQSWSISNLQDFPRTSQWFLWWNHEKVQPARHQTDVLYSTGTINRELLLFLLVYSTHLLTASPVHRSVAMRNLEQSVQKSPARVQKEGNPWPKVIFLRTCKCRAGNVWGIPIAFRQKRLKSALNAQDELHLLVALLVLRYLRTKPIKGVTLNARSQTQRKILQLN